MKKLLLSLLVFVSANVSAIGNPIMSWNCAELIISLHDADVMMVGDLEYKMTYKDKQIILVSGNRPMLVVEKMGVNMIVVYNFDDPTDRKTFTRCY